MSASWHTCKSSYLSFRLLPLQGTRITVWIWERQRHNILMNEASKTTTINIHWAECSFSWEENEKKGISENDSALSTRYVISCNLYTRVFRHRREKWCHLHIYHVHTPSTSSCLYGVFRKYFTYSASIQRNPQRSHIGNSPTIRSLENKLLVFSDSKTDWSAFLKSNSPCW